MTMQNLGLELRYLKTLKAIHQSGSLVEAASRLHLTQSALSHQLKELEHRIGMEVFIRKSRPPRFTTAGLNLLELAEEVLPRFKATEQRLMRLAGGKAGRLHIAIECHSCYQWLMPTITEYRQHWAEVEMDFSTAFNFAPYRLFPGVNLILWSRLTQCPLMASSTSPFFVMRCYWPLPGHTH